jgi:hydroxymethylglutaryl-CoA reductase (NADPH)
VTAQPNGFAAPEGTPSAQDLLNLDKYTDEQIVDFIDDGKVPLHHLEYRMKDLSRAVRIRRSIILGSEAEWSSLPYEDYDWENVRGANAENVIGYATIPIGVVNNLIVNDTSFRVPLGTTEGCLIASTQRGAKAIMLSGGVNAAVTARGMTRAPVVKFANAKRAAEFQKWIQTPENYRLVEEAFNSTTRFGRLASIKTKLVGRNAYIRFACDSGDAMGMNMVSKGSEKAMSFLETHFPDMDVISIAGNFCTDKKASAVNWIEGRGRSVVADVTLKAEVIKNVLKTTVDSMVDLNVAKNMLGSALAGSIGGFNAHAANLVAAVFLACGQDPAQVIESSSCITHMEKTPEGDLYMSVTMPSIEVGTVGGGTSLATQGACLDMLGVRGSSAEVPGTNGDILAEVIAGTVLAGELSLLGAQAAGHLVQSHMRLNRKPADTTTPNGVSH